MRRQAITVLAVVGMVVAACGSDSDLSGPDPSVEAGVNMYSYTWEPTDSSVAGGDRTFLLHVPEDYLEAPEEALPLLVFLHGYDAAMVDNPDAVAAQPLLGVVEVLPQRFAVLAPAASQDDYNEFTWRPDYINDLITHVQVLIDIDGQRISVAGHSWGTGGVLAFGMEYPDLPAALITLSGGWPSGGIPDDICAISSIPMRIYHGSADFVVSPQDSKRIADALAECGSQVEYTELADVAHEADAVVFSDLSFYDWLLEQTRRS
jgi:predicted peptidase